MAEFAQLVLSVDARGVKAGTAALDGLESQARQTERATENMSAAGRAVGPAFSVAGGGARMLTQQLSQVGQQTMATGNFMQALAIQLPDIGLGFGAVGTAAGLLAGIVLPTLGEAIFGVSEDARTFEDVLSDVESRIGSAGDAVELLTQTSADLAAQFGQVNEQVRAIVIAQGDVAIRKLAEEAGALRDELTGLYPGSGFFNISQAEQLYRNLDLTGDASQRLSRQLIALKQADSLGEQLDIVSTIREEFEASVGPVSDMTASQFEFFSYTVDTESAMLRTLKAIEDVRDAQVEVATQTGYVAEQISIASGAASTFASGLAAAQGPAAGLLAKVQSIANAAWDAASAWAFGNSPQGQSIALGGVRPSAGDIIGTQDQQAAITRAEMQIKRYQASLRNVASAAGRGGGGSPGGGGAVDTAEDLREAYDNLMGSLDPLINAQQDLAEGTRIADDALAAGVISADEHAAAIAKLGDEYSDATNKGSVWTDALSDGIEDLGDAFGDFIASGMKDFDSFAESLRRTFSEAVSAMVAEAAAAKLGQALGSFAGPVGSVIGSIAGSLIGGLFGGGSTPYEETEQYDIDQEKAALIQQMHVLEGHSNYLKKQEIEAYDESNQALARKVQLLEEEAAIEAERQSLQMQLWELEGNTEAIRAAQLEQLDESNRALQEQIWAQQDLAAATDETTRAIEEAIAAISPDDYSTQFAYDRAIALAKNGYIPPDGTTPATSANPQQAQVEQTAAMNSQLSTLTSLMRESLTIMRQWNANGLPPEAA